MALAAPLAIVVAGTLAIYDPQRRKQWITMAAVAVLIIIVVYVPFVFLTEPRLESVTARPG